MAVRHVVHLVDETDDYFRYFACYEYAKRNDFQNQITLHYILRRHACMFDQLEIPHKFFPNWIVLRMLGIRDCVPLNSKDNLKIANSVKLELLRRKVATSHIRLSARLSSYRN